MIPSGTSSTDIWGAFNSYYQRKINEKQRKILKVITFKDVVGKSFSHEGKKVTMVRCFVMKELEKHVKWGLTLRELADLIQTETEKLGNKMDITTSDAYGTFNRNARWSAIIEDLLGRNYTSKGSLALPSTTVKGPCVPGEYMGKLRIILEGDEVNASRVRMYKDAYKGKTVQRHFCNSLTDRGEAQLKLVGDGPRLMEDFYAVKRKWNKWKESRDNFFKPV